MTDEEAADADLARRLLLRAVCRLELAKCVKARNQAVAAHNGVADALRLLAPPEFSPRPTRLPARFRQTPAGAAR